MRAVLTEPWFTKNSISKKRLATVGASESSEAKATNDIDQKQCEKKPCTSCLISRERSIKASPAIHNDQAKSTAKEGDKIHDPSLTVIPPSVSEISI